MFLRLFDVNFTIMIPTASSNITTLTDYVPVSPEERVVLKKTFKYVT